MTKKEKIEEAFMDYAEESLENAEAFEPDTVDDFWLQDVPTCEEEHCPCQENG